MSELPCDAAIDRANRNDSHSLVHEQLRRRLPPGARVLEVRCATGTLGAALRQAGLRVTGVEPMAAAAALATPRLDEVFVGTAEAFFDARPDSPFAAIAFGDVLEHLAQPAALLRRAQAHLEPEGGIAASVPNATDGGVRAMLMKGRWDLQTNGILDRTHLRCFGRAGLLALFSDAGLAVEHLADDGAVDVFQHLVVARPAGEATGDLNAPWLTRPLSRPVPQTRPWRRRLRAARGLWRAGLQRESR
jgi:SAM-dependent methyltransferase